jgi:coenzyme F420-reducing hydrogenase delta subunit
MGIQKERLKMIFVSAAEGERFRQFCVEMDTAIKKIGPNPMKSLPSSPTPAMPAKTA